MSTQNQSAVWPHHFPANCPPTDARDLSDTTYYLVENNPPVAADFRSALEKGWFKTQPQCERASLSCGLSEPYILQLRKAIPRLSNHLVSTSTLTKDDGKIKQTGKPGHHSMWLCDLVLNNAPKLFKVVP